jgi:hypothetical protein
MAQRIQTFLLDDFDGSAADGTVRFGLDGTQYEIDLNEVHAKELRTALARYIAAGRRVAGARAAGSGRRAPANGISNTEIRTWAKGNGIKINERGRIPATVRDQYQAAGGK